MRANLANLAGMTAALKGCNQRREQHHPHHRPLHQLHGKVEEHGWIQTGKDDARLAVQKPENDAISVEKKRLPQDLKNHIVNDVDVCILCGICQRRCPCAAIVVEKPNRKWTIDKFPVSSAERLRARMPEALPVDGAWLARAFEGDVHPSQ